MTQGETSVKNVNTNEPNKLGDPDSPNICVFNEYGFIRGAFILPP